MEFLEDCKYKDVKFEDVVDENGYVYDVEFAKYLIHKMWDSGYSRYKDDKFWKGVDENLIYMDGDFYIRRQDEDGETGIEFGGPAGYSGIGFYTIEAFAEMRGDGYMFEDDMNDTDCVFVVLDNKVVPFLVWEAD